MKIKIDPEFQKLIPPLTPEERAQLEANLIADGCREPLTYWQETGILLDGHNRQAICEANGIDFDVWPVSLVDRLAAKEWIIRNQFGRRNLPAIARVELSLHLKDVWAERAKENRLEGNAKGGASKSYQESDTTSEESPAQPIHTIKEIAKAAEVSHDTVHKVEKLKAAPNYEEARARILAGETSINAEYEKNKAAEKIEQNSPELAQQVRNGEIRPMEAKRLARKMELSEKAKALPDGKYRVIYADPPWQYGDKRGGEGITATGAEHHYPTMPLSDLKALDVRGMSADDSVLFLWATSPLLPDALELAEAWGFKYKASFVWDKVAHNMGHYNSVRHEFLLVCTRGSATPDNVKLFDSVQVIEKTKVHSQKPEEFRTIIETLYQHGGKVELFRRGNAPEGWNVWGNEVE